MEYLHTDLGYVKGGAVVSVGLRGTEANVLIMDTSNFQNYRRQSSYRYYGGHYRSSPVRIAVPYSGHWHVVVDLGGFGGRVEAEVSLLAA